MYGRIDVNLIHLALLQHEQMLVQIQIAQIVRGGGPEEGYKDTGYGQMMIRQISALQKQSAAR
jgi:hypothetical protein